MPNKWCSLGAAAAAAATGAGAVASPAAALLCVASKSPCYSRDSYNCHCLVLLCLDAWKHCPALLEQQQHYAEPLVDDCSTATSESAFLLCTTRQQPYTVFPSMHVVFVALRCTTPVGCGDKRLYSAWSMAAFSPIDKASRLPGASCHQDIDLVATNRARTDTVAGPSLGGILAAAYLNAVYDNASCSSNSFQAQLTFMRSVPQESPLPPSRQLLRSRYHSGISRSFAAVSYLRPLDTWYCHRPATVLLLAVEWAPSS